MYYRQHWAAVLAMLVSLVGVQPASFAGQGKLLGHVVTVGHHHIRQPDPPKQSVPLLNVMNFGATGNGVTDDTAAIQNCFNAAHANGEGVLFPAGTYLHASTVTANSIPIFGVGGASTILANNPMNPVILTGVGPSIQNIVVSSASATGTGSNSDITLFISAAQGFVVQGITIVQGTGMLGTFLQQSGVGNVSSVTYMGTGSVNTSGILMDGCANVSLLGNLLVNEPGTAILIGNSGFLNNSIAIIGNSIITNVASAGGILLSQLVVADVAQNNIQLASPTSGTPITVNFRSSNLSISQNVTSGGFQGVNVTSDQVGNSITQNIIRNCGGNGVNVFTVSGTGNLPILSNQFGECGLSGPGQSVIQLFPNGPNDITLFNNIYAGHANGMANFIFSTAHLNFVSGNTQLQTALPNTLP